MRIARCLAPIVLLAAAATTKVVSPAAAQTPGQNTKATTFDDSLKPRPKGNDAGATAIEYGKGIKPDGNGVTAPKQ